MSRRFTPKIVTANRLREGDVVYLTDAPGGVLQISPYDPEVARQIELGEEIMDEYRDTFRALAK